MTFLIKLLLGTGLGEAAASWVAKGLLAALAIGVLYGAYQWAWAAPRERAATLEGQLQGCYTELGACGERKAEWEAAVSACSVRTAELGAKCTVEVGKADAKAREALAAAKARRVVLLQGNKTGPEAMNAFFQEIYQ